MEVQNFPSMDFLNGVALAELHMHISTSVTPTILWDLAHAQGIRLPTKNFFEFAKMVTLEKSTDYESYLKMYDMLEEIQSSPEALFTLVQQVSNNVVQENNTDLLEIRMNPILRAKGGKIDLDHIIVFTLQGMERAMLKYPMKLGLILSMDRRFTNEENAAIVKKAIKYKDRGVVGIDLSGPINRNDNAKAFRPRQIADIVREAHDADLGVTIHTGEATDLGEMWEVLTELKPERIGHGIVCVEDPEMMKYLVNHNIVLETCPTSNLKTQVIKNIEEMRDIYQVLKAHDVFFTINTDGPILQKTNLKKEYTLLYEHGILDEKDILSCNQIAHNASFIR